MVTISPFACTYSESAYLRFADVIKPYFELVDGRLIQKHLGEYTHAILEAEVAGMVAIWARTARPGIGGVEGRVRFPRADGTADHRLPDILFHRDKKLSNDPVGNSFTPPTVAIEIRSETETLRNQQEKCRWYRERGVPVCWLIDPYGRFAEIYVATNDGTRIAADGILTTDAMPGFVLDLTELFATL